MREWNFENGIRVVETEYNYDLHSLKVYNGEEYLGTVYPADVDYMMKCFAALDAGNDPISDKWEDGCGNTCTLDGWEEQSDE